VSLTPQNVATALAWGAAAAGAAWLLSWPGRRRSVGWLIVSVAVTGTAASAGALLGAVHSMLLPMGDNVELLLLTIAAGVLGLCGAGLAAHRITGEHRAVADGLAALAIGRLPADPARPATTRTLQDQLQVTAAALAESREREQALERSRRELVAWMSHDLRTPLAGLRAMAEALEDDLAADPHLYYKQIGASVERLTAMVEDLFELSRVQAGAFGQHPEPIGLNGLISSCVAALAPLAGTKGIELHSRVEVDACVRGSAAELSRALTNVIANAIRHTPDRGHVAVRLGAVDASTVEVSVNDQCGGIAEDVRCRVFDVGYRESSARGARSGDGGAGLGLAITRGIVEAHGGSVEVHNAVGGCRFDLRLPIA
jgi:signal transduction histidine kinase